MLLDRTPTLFASRNALPPEGALRLRPGEAGSAAPADESGSQSPFPSPFFLRYRKVVFEAGAKLAQQFDGQFAQRGSFLPRIATAIVLIAAYAHVYSATGPNDAQKAAVSEAGACKPVYLTFDTGHMGVAPLIAEVLKRNQVKVTFFAANERTKEGDGSLGNFWGPWWKARAAEGHEFASHTYDHAYWRGDVKGIEPRFRIRPTAGAFEGREFTWTAQQYCEQLDHAATRLQDFTGKKSLPLFRAPGGKTSPKLLAAAKACGYEHAGWAPAGFLGDELPSEKYPNDALLKNALKNIAPGDILVAHLGIWSRADPWAPAVLEPLITGLKAQGFCFQTLREHPQYKPWIKAQADAAAPVKQVN